MIIRYNLVIKTIGYLFEWPSLYYLKSLKQLGLLFLQRNYLVIDQIFLGGWKYTPLKYSQFFPGNIRSLKINENHSFSAVSEILSYKHLERHSSSYFKSFMYVFVVNCPLTKDLIINMFYWKNLFFKKSRNLGKEF